MHGALAITPWPSTTSLGPLNSTKRACIAPHRVLGITFTTLYGTPGITWWPYHWALYSTLGAYILPIMGHWGSPYDHLLPLMEHCRGLGVRGFSDLVLRLIFNDLWVVLARVLGWSSVSHQGLYRLSECYKLFLNGLWVVLVIYYRDLEWSLMPNEGL